MSKPCVVWVVEWRDAKLKPDWQPRNNEYFWHRSDAEAEVRYQRGGALRDVAQYRVAKYQRVEP